MGGGKVGRCEIWELGDIEGEIMESGRYGSWEI